MVEGEGLRERRDADVSEKLIFCFRFDGNASLGPTRKFSNRYWRLFPTQRWPVTVCGS